jgi:hypothetical protein
VLFGEQPAKRVELAHAAAIGSSTRSVGAASPPRRTSSATAWRASSDRLRLGVVRIHRPRQRDDLDQGALGLGSPLDGGEKRLSRSVDLLGCGTAVLLALRDELAEMRGRMQLHRVVRVPHGPLGAGATFCPRLRCARLSAASACSISRA